MRQIYSIFFLLVVHQVNAQCWKLIDAGDYYSVGIKIDGTIWACGDNSKGQLGNGTNLAKNFLAQIGSDNSWSAVSASQKNHVLALKIDGTLWSWGSNSAGQLGVGTTTDKSSPTQVGTDSDWKSISSGDYFSLALKLNGTLWAWGANGGLYGNGTNVSSNSPVQVGTDSDWKKINTSGGHCLAIKVDGSLWSWGSNNNGELGIGNTLSKNTPQKVSNATDWSEIFSGAGVSFGIKQNGLLFAWGSYSNYNLGSGSTSDELSPIQIGTDPWKCISSWLFTFGIKLDGTLWIWGNHPFANYSKIPKQILGQPGWTTIATGDAHLLALKLDGSFWSMGSNFYGQLGNGSNIDLSNLTNTNCITTNINERTFWSKTISLFPNPVFAELNLEIPNNEDLDIEVLNELGQSVTTSLRVEANKINLQNIPPGHYLLRVKIGESTYSKTFIKLNEQP